MYTAYSYTSVEFIQQCFCSQNIYVHFYFGEILPNWPQKRPHKFIVLPIESVFPHPYQVSLACHSDQGLKVRCIGSHKKQIILPWNDMIDVCIGPDALLKSLQSSLFNVPVFLQGPN